MRKTIVLLAVVVGLTGLQMNAEARGGRGGGGGGGGGNGAGVRSEAMGTQSAGNTAGQQSRVRSRNRYQAGSSDYGGTGAGVGTRDRLQLRDPSLHADPAEETPTE